jgi:3',5'-nucleoside bisphosphate phosphatase
LSRSSRARHQQLDQEQATGTGHPPSTIDLHTHTDRSDGVLQPGQLVSEAAAVGVRLLAITDHDTLAGYRSLTSATSPPLPDGLRLLPGVEINSITVGLPELWEGELHILGLGVRPDDDALEAQLARQREARRLRFERTLERLRELGLPIDAQAAALSRGAEDALGRPMIGRLLIEAGFATSVEDAFQRLLARGQPAYVPRMGMGPIEAIHVIREAGGLASLAHFAEAPSRIGLLRELKEAGLDGLEVFYRSFDTPTVEAVGAVASALALVPTGGSDYHGDLGTYAEAHASLWVPPEVGTNLLERLGNVTAPAPS